MLSVTLAVFTTVYAGYGEGSKCLLGKYVISDYAYYEGNYVPVHVEIDISKCSVGKVNVTVRLKVLPVKGVDSIAYTPPLLDFTVVTADGRSISWSSGKFFIQVVKLVELPISECKYLVVSTDCVKSLIIHVRALRYERLVTASPEELLKAVCPAPVPLVGTLNITMVSETAKGLPKPTSKAPMRAPVTIVPTVTPSTTKVSPQYRIATKTYETYLTYTVTRTVEVTKTVTTVKTLTKTSTVVSTEFKTVTSTIREFGATRQGYSPQALLIAVIVGCIITCLAYIIITRLLRF